MKRIVLVSLILLSFMFANRSPKIEEALVLQDFNTALKMAQSEFFVTQNGFIYYYLGSAYAGFGRDKLVDATYKKALDSDLLESTHLYNIAEYYENKNNLDEAIRVYNIIKGRVDSTRQLKANYKLGELYFKKKDYAKAIDILSNLIQDDERRANPLAYFVGLSYYVLKDDINAEFYFEMALKYNYRIDDIYFKQAELKNNRGLYREAISLYRQGIDISGGKAPASVYNNMGVAYTNLNEFIMAADSFRRAIKRGMDSYQLYTNYAQVLSRIKRYEENIDLLSGLGEKLDNNSDLLFYLGEAYDKLGKKEEAISFYEKSLSLGVRNEDVVKEALERLRRAR